MNANVENKTGTDVSDVTSKSWLTAIASETKYAPIIHQASDGAIPPPQALYNGHASSTSATSSSITDLPPTARRHNLPHIATATHKSGQQYYDEGESSTRVDAGGPSVPMPSQHAQHQYTMPSQEHVAPQQYTQAAASSSSVAQPLYRCHYRRGSRSEVVDVATPQGSTRDLPGDAYHNTVTARSPTTASVSLHLSNFSMLRPQQRSTLAHLPTAAAVRSISPPTAVTAVAQSGAHTAPRQVQHYVGARSAALGVAAAAMGGGQSALLPSCAWMSTALAGSNIAATAGDSSSALGPETSTAMSGGATSSGLQPRLSSAFMGGASALQTSHLQHMDHSATSNTTSRIATPYNASNSSVAYSSSGNVKDVSSSVHVSDQTTLESIGNVNRLWRGVRSTVLPLVHNIAHTDNATDGLKRVYKASGAHTAAVHGGTMHTGVSTSSLTSTAVPSDATIQFAPSSSTREGINMLAGGGSVLGHRAIAATELEAAYSSTAPSWSNVPPVGAPRRIPVGMGTAAAAAAVVGADAVGGGGAGAGDKRTPMQLTGSPFVASIQQHRFPIITDSSAAVAVQPAVADSSVALSAAHIQHRPNDATTTTSSVVGPVFEPQYDATATAVQEPSHAHAEALQAIHYAPVVAPRASPNQRSHRMSYAGGHSTTLSAHVGPPTAAAAPLVGARVYSDDRRGEAQPGASKERRRKLHANAKVTTASTATTADGSPIAALDAADLHKSSTTVLAQSLPIHFTTAAVLSGGDATEEPAVGAKPIEELVEVQGVVVSLPIDTTLDMGMSTEVSSTGITSDVLLDADALLQEQQGALGSGGGGAVASSATAQRTTVAAGSFSNVASETRSWINLATASAVNFAERLRSKDRYTSREGAEQQRQDSAVRSCGDGTKRATSGGTHVASTTNVILPRGVDPSAHAGAPRSHAGDDPRLLSAAMLPHSQFGAQSNHNAVSTVSAATDLCWAERKKQGSIYSPRYHHAVARCGSKVYLFGGDTGNFYTVKKYLNDLYVYRPETSKWSQIKPGSSLPVQRCGHTMVSWRRRVNVFGGIGKQGLLNDFWTFDFRMNVWALRRHATPYPLLANNKHEVSDALRDATAAAEPPLATTANSPTGGGDQIDISKYNSVPAPRAYHTAVVSGDCMIVYGGTKADKPGVVWIFDFVGKYWRKIIGKLGPYSADVLPEARQLHTTVRWGLWLYVYGGSILSGGDEGKAVDELWRFHTVTFVWERIEPRGGKSPGGRMGHACAVLEDRMFIQGGRRAYDTTHIISQTQETWSYNLKRNEWAPIPNSLAPFCQAARWGHKLTVVRVPAQPPTTAATEVTPPSEYKSSAIYDFAEEQREPTAGDSQQASALGASRQSLLLGRKMLLLTGGVTVTQLPLH